MRLSLKVAILSSGRTQRAVSLAAGIPETKLSAITRGRCEPDADERHRIATVLGVPESRIFPETQRVVATA